MGNVDTHRVAHENFNKRDFEAAVKDMVDDIEYVDRARGVTFKSRQAFRDEFMPGWASAFSDATVTKPVYIDGGDHTVALFVGTGTNDGPLAAFDPTGRKMELPFCEILRYDADGRVVGGELYYDQLSLLGQLGHIDVPA